MNSWLTIATFHECGSVRDAECPSLNLSHRLLRAVNPFPCITEREPRCRRMISALNFAIPARRFICLG
jgi:hypothetical protein